MNTAKLKAAAERQKSILAYIASYEPGDIDSDTVDLRFEDENGCDTGCDVSIVEECRRSADLIDELIAALEAARADCRENAARIAELESQRALAFSACNRWADKCRDAEKRVAELETRTVKLPESVIDSICLTAAEIHNLGRGVSDERAQDIIDSIRCAAGINLETGGEA
ncbi:hypothetical protein QBS66_13545 [Cronobacter sakazakii]|uniref:hypothetical protein n=1 Tax=Cronobacter sakazakii TaxID=28141 RepID=UPI00283AB218|nr:hypothetical protein [Cronobacter sakazakii]ELY4471583.1 hypothetical protein [Cronobacter sakazakii]WMT60412.1 hypothetical protein QBS66_13545 [Cronobacter sakazakii]